MTPTERKLLLLLATVIGPSSVKWREIRELMDQVKDECGDAK